MNMTENESAQKANARNIITELRDQAFDGSDEQLALALGRPVEEVQALADGSEVPDKDAVIKARGLAEERGVELREPADE